MAWLSTPAVLWAMDEAPGVPARLVSTLVAVARYAGEDGRGAYPSSATIGLVTRKSESQARRDMAELERLGLLRPGDERLVKDIRADRRPKVYDLPVPRDVAEDTPLRGASGRAPSGDSRGASVCAPSQSRGAYGNITGRIQPPNGAHLDAREEVLKTSRTARSRARAGSAAHDAPQNTKPRAGLAEADENYWMTKPWTKRRIWPCPGCGELFYDEDLADEKTRRQAEEGDLWHAECAEAWRAEHPEDFEEGP